MTTENQKPAMITVPMLYSFSIDRVICLMLGAFEQASGYWAQNARHDIPDIYDIEAWREEHGFAERWTHGSKGYRTSDFYLAPFVGGAIEFEEIVDERSGQTKKHTIAGHDFIEGIAVMAKYHPQDFSDWQRGHDDATTADIFLQCCVFGEVKYG